nr:MAG TPA: hypothetical protein [Caudoviricetes sp.]DAX98301.1 MAG TPA: hypothetical protein [Caudoviricetes sp.]
MAAYIVLIVLIVVAVLIAKEQKHKVSTGENEKNTTTPAVIEHVTVASEIPVHWYENGKRKEGIAKMAQGLQVFDTNGKCTVDITDRLTKYLGKFRTYASQNEGIVVDDRLTADGDLWYMSVQRYGQSFDPEWNNSVVVTKENGQLRWRYPQNKGIRYDFDIIYGVY